MSEQVSTNLSRQERITELVVRKTLWLLLRDGGMDRIEVLRMVDPDPGGASISLSERDKEEVILAGNAARKIQYGINNSSEGVISTIAKYERDGWMLTVDNVHREYTIVANMLFEDEISWGRIAVFHLFSASYCIYAIQQGIQEEIVESVCGWTIHYLHRELKCWLLEHPWDQFANDTKKVQLARSNGGHQNGPTITDAIILVVAAVHLTVLLWSLKQGFS